jgi:hypothetical protein
VEGSNARDAHPRLVTSLYIEQQDLVVACKNNWEKRAKTEGEKKSSGRVARLRVYAHPQIIGDRDQLLLL